MKQKSLLALVCWSILLVAVNGCGDDEKNPTGTITLEEIEDIQYFEAIARATIDAPESLTIEEKGFCYNEEGDPSIGDELVIVTRSSNRFSATIDGLESNTAYFIKAFFIDESGAVIYSEEKSFKTLRESSLTPTTSDASNITHSSAVLKGSVKAGKENIVMKGFCYSVNPKPDIRDEITEEGSGAGEFSSTLTNLTPSTTYHYRAYARISTGDVRYSAEKTFTTSGESPGGGDPGDGDPGTADYLIYGVVYGQPDLKDCPEGYGIASDYKAVYTQKIVGSWSSTYTQKREELLALMKSEYPGQREYIVESSWFANQKAKFAVIVQYQKKLSGWNCRHKGVAIGYGTTAEQALQSALNKRTSKVDDTYTILRQESW